MVQEVLTDDSGTRTVEVHGSNIRRIVGDEEVSVNRWEQAKEYWTFDAERVCQWKHGNNDSALRVDEYRHSEECECDGPRILSNDALQTILHLGHIIAEICISQPGDTIDSDNCNHTRLPYSARNRFLWLSLSKQNHTCCGCNHDNLDDEIHLQRLDFGSAVSKGLSGLEVRTNINIKNLADREENDNTEGEEEDINRTLCLRSNLLVEQGGRVAIHVLIEFGVLTTCLELGILIEVETTLVAGSSSSHQTAKTCRNGDGDNLEVADIKAIGSRNGSE